MYDAGFTVFNLSVYSVVKLYFDPKYFLRLAQRRWFAWKKSKSTTLQVEANELFSGNRLRLEATLSRALSLYYIGCFFMALLPMASLFIFLSFTGIYFVEKYLFARRYRRPIAISGELANKCLSGLGTGLHIFIVRLKVIRGG